MILSDFYEGLASLGLFWILYLCISLLLLLLVGYLFNYFIIKELREINKSITTLTDTMAYHMSHRPQPQQQSHQYQMRNKQQGQGVNLQNGPTNNNK